MTTIFLIRHAETDAIGKWIAGWTPGVCLNRVGVTQAARLAELDCRFGQGYHFARPAPSIEFATTLGRSHGPLIEVSVETVV